jgi:hypothetical protein
MHLFMNGVSVTHPLSRAEKLLTSVSLKLPINDID